MQAAQLTVPANPPVRDTNVPSALHALTPPAATTQPALDLRRQTLSRCWGA